MSLDEEKSNIRLDKTTAEQEIVRTIDALENSIDTVSETLIKLLEKQKGGSVAKAIRSSGNKISCTRFEEPSYADLGHFYANLINNTKNMAL